jgi:glycosyltransferase involved in cell wall biosynthesis
MWLPFTELQRQGLGGVHIPPVGQENFLPSLDELDDFRVLVHQRPGGRAGFRAWEWYKAKARPALVYETDDNLLQADTSLPHWKAAEIMDSTRACIGLADLVTVSTEPLAEAVRGQVPGADVRVLPNRIHADLLGIERPRRDRLTIGWAGGSTHVRDVALIQEPLRGVLIGDHADMHFIGEDLSSLAGKGRFTEWQPNVWDYYRKIDFDIGVIPLTSSPFNDCRSAIKALEYAALGIPVVASAMPAYSGFVQHGVTGYLASSEEDWRKYLWELVSDADARAEMGAAARALAARHTVQEHWTAWADVYAEVGG